MRAVSLIEPLEDRIAPAGVTVAPNGKSASYTDSTGDSVHVTTTKGIFATSQFIFDPSTAGQLTQLTLAGHKDFTGANIVFTVFPVAGGSATVNVGYIDALGLNLGSVTIPGDLARIDVGAGTAVAALGKLTVDTLGAVSTTQGGLSYSTESNITGTVGTVNILGNLDGALNAQDYNGTHPGTGNIGHLNIGGSLDGNNSSGAGVVLFTGTLGTAVIGGGIEGGSSELFGSISGAYGTLSKIGSVTVKGSVPDDPNPNPIPTLPGTSILGGSALLTGGINAATIGSVSVAGDVLGGTGTASGVIQAGLNLAKVTVAGSLIGGNFTPGSPSQAASSGAIAAGSMGSVTIGKNIYGGSGLNSGEVISTGTIQKVTVMGDVAGGSAGQSGNGLAGSIHGKALGSVIIEGSLIGGNMVSGDATQTGNSDGVIISDTTIGSVSIAKNLVGGSGTFSGMIESSLGGIGSVYIGKNMIGGSGNSSGIISARGTLGTLTIGVADTTSGGTSDSSVLGGAGASSGSISVDGPLKNGTLTHDLTGGAGVNSGTIATNGEINSLAIQGNVTGGSADNTGTISAFGLLKSLSIKGNLTGSNNSGSTLLVNTGYVQANGIGTMKVGGALTAGTPGTGGLDTSGAIKSLDAIGSLTVGSIAGNAENAAVISAVGQAHVAATAKTDVAIQSLTVTGNVSYADILAGYNADTQNGTRPLGAGVNADAQIGTVTIGGNLTATNIIAGVGPGTSGSFGTADSMALSGLGVTDLKSIISKISKVVIAGSVIPTASTTDTYGIAAQYIVSATVTGKPLGLTPGPDNDTFGATPPKDIPLPVGNANADEFLYEV